MQIMYLPFLNYNANCNPFCFYLLLVLHHSPPLTRPCSHLALIPYQWLCIAMTQFSSHSLHPSHIAFCIHSSFTIWWFALRAINWTQSNSRTVTKSFFLVFFLYLWPLCIHFSLSFGCPNLKSGDKLSFSKNAYENHVYRPMCFPLCFLNFLACAQCLVCRPHGNADGWAQTHMQWHKSMHTANMYHLNSHLHSNNEREEKMTWTTLNGNFLAIYTILNLQIVPAENATMPIAECERKHRERYVLCWLLCFSLRLLAA